MLIPASAAVNGVDGAGRDSASCGADSLLQRFRGRRLAGARKVLPRNQVGLTVGRRVRLEAPTLGKRPDVVRVIADGVEEMRHGAFRGLVITRNRQRRAMRVACGALKGAELRKV